MDTRTNKKANLYSDIEEDFYTPGVRGKLYLILAGARPAIVKNIPYEARVQRYFGGILFVMACFAIVLQTYLFLALKINFSSYFLGLLFSGLLILMTVFFFRYINSDNFNRIMSVVIMIILVPFYWVILTPLSLSYQKDELRSGIETYRFAQADSIRERYIRDSSFTYETDAEAKLRRDSSAPYNEKMGLVKDYLKMIGDSITLTTYTIDTLQKKYDKLSSDTVKTKVISDSVKSLRRSIVRLNTLKDSTVMQIRRVNDSLESLQKIFIKNYDDRTYIALKNNLGNRRELLEKDMFTFQGAWTILTQKVKTLETELQRFIRPGTKLIQDIQKANNKLSVLQFEQAAANNDLRTLQDSVVAINRIDRLENYIGILAVRRDSLLINNLTMPVNWILVADTTGFLSRNNSDFGAKFFLLSMIGPLILFFLFGYAIFRKNYYRPVYTKYIRIQETRTETKAKSFIEIEELRHKNIVIDKQLVELKEKNISDFEFADSAGNSSPENHYYTSALKKEEIARRTKNTSYYDRIIFESALEDINRAIEITPARSDFWELKSRLFFFDDNVKEGEQAAAKFRELRSEELLLDNISNKIGLSEISIHGLPFFGSFSWRLNPGVNILLGRNGYGKSHFLSILCSILKDDYNKAQQLSRINESSAATDRSMRVYLSGGFRRDSKLIEAKNEEIQRLMEENKHMENAEKKKKNKERIAKRKTELQLEEGMIMLTPSGLISSKGQVPVLAIPDMRFVNKAREYTDQTVSDLLKGDNYLRNSSYHFINQEPFESVLQNLLNLLGISYFESGRTFNPYIFQIVSNVFEDLTGNTFRWDRCELDANGYKITVITEGNSLPLPIQKISQGTFSVLSIVGLIYIFLQKKYPSITDDEELVKQQAIVIIDEIDAHLHPLWQQKIVTLIRGIFENCQFIITAHSPMVVAGCKEGEVAVMKDERNESNVITGFKIHQFREDFIGVPIENLYKKIFDVEETDQQYQLYTAMQPFMSEMRKEKDELESLHESGSLDEKDQRRLKKLKDDLYYAEKVKETQDQQQTPSMLEDENITLKVSLESVQKELETFKRATDTTKL